MTRRPLPFAAGIVIFAAGIVICALGNLVGAWWLSIVVGAALGLVVGGWLAGLAGLIGWLVDLAVVATNGPVLGAARVSAAIAGLGAGAGPLLLVIGAAGAFAGAGLAGALVHNLLERRRSG
ncbi:hypothetical protein Afer_0611 [Acidimicrobium ferrooxidans DSM 10331]|uniref:Uncharacterized protein n=1 Tax=Acidimicrobium ferrooxidans (strain DSM 10331 / JCM 15462 / NBRC 103882 / ICP) TaxID=525909 RepID=C7LXV7_ACIFD|nr:hypothetical protein [Acidimicrobium ferrooxidans]ACU53565.1 hypothetical protein Afer_0611 [Acidimicrobium ferrooxidans DSM 10331]